MRCPEPEVWARQVLEGASLPEGLEDHLASCPSCQEEVTALASMASDGRIPEEARSRALRRVREAQGGHSTFRRRFAWAAAAGLMFWVSWRWMGERGVPAPASLASPLVSGGVRSPQPLPAPSGTWSPVRAQRAVLGRSVAATASAGSRIRCVPADEKADGKPMELFLEAGQLLLETQAEPVRLRLGSAEVVLDHGVVEAGWRSPQPSPHASHASLFLDSAYASEASEPLLFVRILGGSAILRINGSKDEQKVAAGQEACPASGGGWTLLPIPVPPDGWLPLETPPSLRDQEVALALAPEGDYSYEILVRKVDPSAECALLFVAGGRSYEIPLGAALPALKAGGWTRLSVEVRDGWCRAVSGPCVLVSSPVSGLPLKTHSGSLTGLGLRAWGGDVGVSQARWRKPAP